MAIKNEDMMLEKLNKIMHTLAVFYRNKNGLETGYDNVNVGFTYGGIEFGCIGWCK